MWWIIAIVAGLIGIILALIAYACCYVGGKADEYIDTLKREEDSDG